MEKEILQFIKDNENLFNKLKEQLEEDNNLFSNLDWLDYSFDELVAKQKNYYQTIKNIFEELDIINYEYSNSIYQYYKDELVKLNNFESLYFESIWDIKKRYMKNLSIILNMLKELTIEYDIFI